MALLVPFFEEMMAILDSLRQGPGFAPAAASALERNPSYGEAAGRGGLGSERSGADGGAVRSGVRRRLVPAAVGGREEVV